MKIITIRHSDNNDIKTYINQHSKHFDEKSLEFALKNMTNDDNSDHKFNTEYIQQYIEQHNIAVPNTSNIYDITYTANMAYADFYPNILHSEEDCIKYAIAVANDIDGYEGIQFRRWLVDIMSKNINLN